MQGCFFVSWEYHLKNNVICPEFQPPMLFVNQWRLPLLFVISGLGTCFSISKRRAGGFVLERARRLLVPLVFGMLVIVPPQVYFERLLQGVSYHSYMDFYPVAIFNGSYPEGNFSWHHLWFLPYLFLFSLILLVVKKGIDPLAGWVEKKELVSYGWFVLLLVTIPTYLCEYFLRPYFPVTHALTNDWFTFCNYLWLFVCGYFFARSMKVCWPMFSHMKYVTFILGIITFLCWYVPVTNYYPVRAFIRAFNMWCWIFSLMGFAIAFFYQPRKWIGYANEAVYPFYILHQTILIAIGYYIGGLHWPVMGKFLIMVLGTYIGCWILYEGLIRRVNLLRFLFGMKKK